MHITLPQLQKNYNTFSTFAEQKDVVEVSRALSQLRELRH